MIDSIQIVIDANPGSPEADKLEDIVAKLAVASAEFSKMPPENIVAVRNLEAAVGDLQAAIDAGLVNPAQGNGWQNEIVALALAVANIAINLALIRAGAPPVPVPIPVDIVEAQKSVVVGIGFFDLFKFLEAIKEFLEALEKAEAFNPA